VIAKSLGLKMKNILKPNAVLTIFKNGPNFTPVVSLTHSEQQFCFRSKPLATTLSMKSHTSTHCGPIFVFVTFATKVSKWHCFL